MNFMALLCPSLMCADFSNLENEISSLEAAGVDIFHCDIMDGTFVPNFAMGLNDVKAIKENTEKLVDVHLMVENPSDKVELFIDMGVDIIYIHPESERYVSKTLHHIKENNIGAGLAVNPDTSIQTIVELLDYIDYLLVMTVNPGFAGQKFIKKMEQKITELVTLKKEYNYKILLDGACSPEIIKKYSDLGCDGFILGTSALFGKGKEYNSIIKELKKL